jgi:hypothetical protein|tara:strand:+ start:21818 stop:22276 length:459 start_codon:yes stop_codon:yes gene_type:complete
MFSKPIKEQEEEIQPESDQEQNNMTNPEPDMTEVMLSPSSEEEDILSNDEFDPDFELDNEYLENYENELTYGDILGQFLEDDMGKNVAENLNDLVQGINNLNLTDLIKSINQQSKCIIKLQKTVEIGIATIVEAMNSNKNTSTKNTSAKNKK